MNPNTGQFVLEDAPELYGIKKTFLQKLVKNKDSVFADEIREVLEVTFQVGEAVTIKGYPFEIARITKNQIMLKGLPLTPENCARAKGYK